MAAIEETFTASVSQMSEKQNDSNAKFLEELKDKEQKFKVQIKESLEALEYSNEQQQLALSNMRKAIIDKLTQCNTKLQQHTKRIQTEMDAIKQKTLDNMQELQKISSSLNEERCLIEEEQKLMEDFQNKMQALQKKRSNCASNIATNVETLEKAQQFVTTQLEGSSKLKQIFLEKNATALEANCQLVDKLTSEIELYIDQNVAKCSTLNIQMENKIQETTKSVQTKTDNDNLIHAELKQKLAEYGPQIKRLCSENRVQHKEKTDVVLTSLDEGIKRSRNHVIAAKSFNSTLQICLKDYTKVYKEQMQTCANDVETFRKSEIKTYTATGATPSKKEFKYPRVLVSTSPHSNIVKRFRQENDWSDMDMTIPVDEVSTIA